MTNTILTGIKSSCYLAQFLGRKIAVKRSENEYDIYNCLWAIYANQTAVVRDKEERETVVSWEKLENPYILLTTRKDITIK